MHAVGEPFISTVLEAKLALREENGICRKVIRLFGAGMICRCGMNLPQSWPSRQICMPLWNTVLVNLCVPRAPPGGHQALVGASIAQAASDSGMPGSGGGSGGNGGSGM